MDEVKAGESVGRAVGTGLRSIRRNAVRAGQAGAEQAAKAAVTAEHKLAERTSTLLEGVETASEDLVKRGRKARRELARNAKKSAKRTAKQLDKRTKKATRKAGKKVTADTADFSRKVQKKLAKLEHRTDKLRKRASKNPSGRRRGRTLLVLGVGGLAAAAAVMVVRSRQSAPEPEAPVIPLGGEPSTNGVAPESTHAEHKN